MTDLKIKKVRFVVPVDVAGVGMVDRLNLDNDVDTGLPMFPGVLATFLAEDRMVRISSRAGETWVPVENVSSLQPVYVDRLEASKAAKAAKPAAK